MELPKIKKENLTQELREVVGDADIEFDSIVNPADVIVLPSDVDGYREERQKTAEMLIESRQKLHKLRTEVRKP